MNEPLSPAAQALLDAYGTCNSTYEAQANTLNTGGQRLAAALRALAVRIKGADAIRQDVLDIAAELEDQ